MITDEEVEAVQSAAKKLAKKLKDMENDIECDFTENDKIVLFNVLLVKNQHYKTFPRGTDND